MKVPVGELQISSSQGTTAELSGNFVDNHSNVLVTGSSTEVVEVDLSLHLPITTYQTEAERKGSNAVSKIYDILRRRNAESQDLKQIQLTRRQKIQMNQTNLIPALLARNSMPMKKVGTERS
ncbi:hypothetical protein OS493_011546 [Desmophyllum pertusum]|uniref:Uncharacterized protein n=1 Tax=Desmophyllum pertusum TaxID=174260 RepID=A0A9X0CNF4_9CNID|nr:hypothetical protein OS493_011546 [Desmophyllum pertusum]